MFQTSVDIGNRACQHIGAPRIGALGFGEDSVQAQEIAFAYDKVRRAELRRNVWRFATRLCPLRPLTATTMQINAPLWSSATVYFIGSLVSDAQGQIWESLIADNVGIAPGGSAGWELYFGPIVCDAWQPSTDYYAGDVVYVAPGDGSFQVYRSTMQLNGVSPTLPAAWLATNVYFKDQVVVVFPLYNAGTTYAAGATVVDANGNFWTSVQSGNVGHTPSSSSAFWTAYPAPAQYPGGTAPNYTGYLYPPTGGGPPASTGQAAQSASSGILEWSPATSYSAGALADYKQTQYVAIGAAANLNLTPSANPASWAPISGGTYYQSLVDLNTNQPPASSPGAWTSALTETASNGPGWLAIPNIYLSSLSIIYPLGSGPLEQAATRNVFRLPANFLREAPQDPKAGSTSYLGGPSGLAYTDWEYQGDFIVSRWASAIVYRFVADVTLVTEMDDMFCEGLGARVGAEVCERVTQSDAKVSTCLRVYQEWMAQARLINGIETGATEPAEDDFLTARL